MNSYVCENCGEKITREEYINQGFNAFCKTCLQLNKKERLKRAKEIFEKRNIKEEECQDERKS